VAGIFETGIFETEEVSEDLYEEVKSSMVARLRDRIAPVRMQAARALARLQVLAGSAQYFTW
jgi:hypothetical protein